MKKASKGLFRDIATRGVIAAIPVAMVSAYASNLFVVPTPPRLAEYSYQQVAEITVSPSTVGIAASPLYGQTKAAIDAQLDEMQGLGVENIRVFVPWGLIELNGPTDPNDPATSAYWAQLDLVMQAAAERNMGVLAEVNATPYWAAADGTGSFTGADTPDTTAFTSFMTKFIGEYGSIVSAYEIWNEPNGFMFSNPIDPAAYADLLKAAYPVIKQADPTATVVAGALGHVINFGLFTMDPVDFVQAMIAADPNIGNYFDALSYHPYDETMTFSGGNVNPNSSYFASDTAYNQVKDMMALFPTKKVWITEFGVPTYTYTDYQGTVHTVTEAQQAAYIQDLLVHWDDLSQAGPIFLYTGRDTGTGTPVGDANYGLWDQTGNPKAVIDYLTQWFIDHPQNPTGPTGPTNPGTPANPFAALAAFFQSLTQQFNQFFSQLFSFSFVSAITDAISNFFRLFAPPAVTTSAPLSLRMASVEDSSSTVDESSPAVEASTVTGDEKGAVVAQVDDEAVPTTKAASVVEVTEAPVSEDVPESSEAAEPVVGVPEVEAPSTDTSVPSAPTTDDDDAADSAGKGDGAGSADSTESDDSDASEKADTDVPPRTVRPSKLKGDSDVAGVGAKPSVGSKSTATAAAASKPGDAGSSGPGSDSAGSNDGGSDGGGSAGGGEG